VNDTVVDHVLWPPYECDVTDALVTGRNVIEVEVANTLRNLCGAHFNYDEDLSAGNAIRLYAGTVGQRKQFKDYGLLTPPEFVVLGKS